MQSYPVISIQFIIFPNFSSFKKKKTLVKEEQQTVVSVSVSFMGQRPTVYRASKVKKNNCSTILHCNKSQFSFMKKKNFK